MPQRDFSRTERVAAEIQRELSAVLHREVKDPRLPLTTVSAVRVSKDLQNCNVYVTFMGRDTPALIKESIEALNHMSGFLRNMLGQRIRMRAMPRMQFHYDEAQVRGQRLSSLITSAVASDAARRGETPEDSSAIAHDDSEE